MAEIIDFKVKNGLIVSTTATINGTTQASSTTTGALIVAGGAGIGKNLYVGGTIYGIATTASTINTVQQTNSNTHYLTFVDSNNASATAESLYTTSSFTINPNNGSVKLYGTLQSTSTVSENSLYVQSGVGINGSLYVKGPAYFDNSVVFSGTSTYVYSTNTIYTDNLINLHVPPGSTGTNHTWTVNDGQDIGFVFHYYLGGDRDAALVLANDTGYLEWYNDGAENLTNGTFTGTSYGIFKTGGIQLVHTTASNSTTTGALTVAGGVGVGQDLYVGGTIYGTINGTLVGNADTVSTVQRTDSGNHYLTFVDSNNASATAESVYTTSSVYAIPSSGQLWATQLRQTSSQVALGYQAGQNTQSASAVAIGDQSGNTSQGQYSIAIGWLSAFSTQSSYAIAIGVETAKTGQGQYSIAFGYRAGFTSQGGNSVAIGRQAGHTSQQNNSIAIGQNAGQNSQGSLAVAIGGAAGETTQGTQSVALGYQAGQTTQGIAAVAIGNGAGNTTQGGSAVAIGSDAGSSNQANNAIAIGNLAGETSQNNESISIGYTAGRSSQGLYAIAIGNQTASTNQAQDAISIGTLAGSSNQSQRGIAIGREAGQTNQGVNAIAIGYRAGSANQLANSIILNASGSAQNATNAGFYVNPIRADATSSATSTLVYYNPTSRELTTASAASISVGSAVQADTVNTVQQTSTNTHYLTFVDSNNASATAESVYTTSSFVIVPSTGNVGLGTTPDSKLHVAGTAKITGITTITNTTNASSTVTGALQVVGGVGIGGDIWVGEGVYATTKSFLINHPTKPGMKLRYGSLEGPENGVYVRGKLNGSNQIELPDYWTKLVDPESITVNLTPIGRHQNLYVEEIINNTVIVKNSNLINKEIHCYYTVYAERIDVTKLQVEI